LNFSISFILTFTKLSQLHDDNVSIISIKWDEKEFIISETEISELINSMDKICSVALSGAYIAILMADS